jgi:apolipoprotein N-acyltransferase
VGLYFVLFGLAWRFISSRCGVAMALLAAPFLWVPLEYIRSKISFMALPFGMLGYTQSDSLQLIQISSVAGVYGVSFVIVTVNSAVFALLLKSYQDLRKRRWPQKELLNASGRNAILSLAIVLVGLSILYGQARIKKPARANEVKISLVQGNTEPRRKKEPDYAKFIMETYANLTREASKEEPALIIWPENTTPRAISIDRELYKQVSRIAQDAGTYLLVGSAQHLPQLNLKTGEIRYHNSAHLISPVRADQNQRYDKVRLMPFGEYIPYKEIFIWSYLKVPKITSYEPGKAFTVLECPSFRFGVAICWESLFPDIARTFVKRGAQFLINITNEAGFGDTAAPSQFLSMNVFRAVENGVYLARAANTGVSCIIDSNGRIVDRVKDAQGDTTFVRGVMTNTVVPMESRTVYNRYGDWLVWLSLIVSGLFLLVAFTRRSEDYPD